jgi:membrane protein DedA with SNARE-associated domain
LELLQTFINDFLTPIGGDPHVGLFLFVWFSAIFPLAPPEEAFTLLGGACIATGVLEPLWGGLAIIGGIIATDLTQYWMGRGGLRLLSGTKIGKRLIRSRSFERARLGFEKKGLWAIIGCRFFFGTRAPTYMATGFLHYSFLKFAIVDSSVVLVHGLAFLSVGYIFHKQIDSIMEFFERLGIWSLVVLVGLIALFFIYKYIKNRRGAAHNDLPLGEN